MATTPYIPWTADGAELGIGEFECLENGWPKEPRHVERQTEHRFAGDDQTRKKGDAPELQLLAHAILRQFPISRRS
ncbi:MAG: hypothetical protein JRJ24_19765 [Deltaproteobacteria bacterium]|nr:hypothetical protein [Deltaproteobacteria bacterium]